MPDVEVQTEPAEAQEAGAASSAEPVVAAPPTRGSVLVIEDEESVRSVVGRALAQDGFRVIEAGNGREGLDEFRRTFPDLVITDIWMPETDGLEAMLQLTQDYPSVKIIAITGGREDRDCLGVAKFFGARRTFRKPFEMMALLEAVRELLAEQIPADTGGPRRRATPRYVVRCAAVFAGDQIRGVGKVVNISRGGCAVESEVPVPKGTYLSILIFLPREGHATAIDVARVQWSTGSEFGLEFIRASQETQQVLQRFLATIQTDGYRDDCDPPPSG